MKNVLKKILLFLVLVIMVDQFGGYALERINLGTLKGDYGRNNYIATQANQDILIFGSSRAIHHYDPTLIGKAFNMSCYNCGEDGMGIILMYARLQMILQRHTPKIIIYDVEPEYDILENDNTRYLGFLRPYYDNPIVQEICCEIDPNEQFKNLSRLYRFNSRFIDIIPQYLSHNPSLAKEYTWNPLFGNIKVRKLMPTKDKQRNLDSLKINYLNQLIDCCEEKRIKLIFVVSPTYGNQNVSSLPTLKTITKAHDIQVLDFHCDTSFSKHSEFFHDIAHLNYQGSVLLTNAVIDTIQNFPY